MIVYKFGGQTIATPERLSRCLDLIEQASERKPVVVVSAHGDTTELLSEAAKGALAGRISIGGVRNMHIGLCEESGVAPGMVEPLLTRLEALLHGIALIKELTPRTLDNVLSFGERLSARVIAGALSQRGLEARPVAAYDIGMLTDSNFGNAAPLPGTREALAAGLKEGPAIPVVTGFIGKDREGNITTLGRSGSDFTATIIASAVGAEEVVIWKNVDGVMTADPSVEGAAENIPRLSFEEASELAYFGAEVLHPSTLVPAIQSGIPVRVANAFKEGDPGTTIFSHPVPTDRIAKSVAYKEDVAMFHLFSTRLLSVPDILGEALAALKETGVVAHMITTSEAGISLVAQSGIGERKLKEAEEALSRIAPVKSYADMAVVCMVGDELRGRTDSVGRVFAALAEAGVNPRAIARSASEINLGFLIENGRIPDAVRALHGLIVSR
ncbi:MAG TPA: aspartate kinase [bacterium]|nr:aspartate kinase [bacterium]